MGPERASPWAFSLPPLHGPLRPPPSRKRIWRWSSRPSSAPPLLKKLVGETPMLMQLNWTARPSCSSTNKKAPVQFPERLWSAEYRTSLDCSYFMDKTKPSPGRTCTGLLLTIAQLIAFSGCSRLYRNQHEPIPSAALTPAGPSPHEILKQCRYTQDFLQQEIKTLKTCVFIQFNLVLRCSLTTQ